MTERERRIPAWLLGLLIAIVVFTGVLVISSILGIGDDPVIESLAPGVWAGAIDVLA